MTRFHRRDHIVAALPDALRGRQPAPERAAKAGVGKRRGRKLMKEAFMRKLLCTVSVAAAAVLMASSAQAASTYSYRHHRRALHVHVYRRHNPAAPVDTTAGVAAGAAIGAGTAEGAFGASATAALPATAAGAAAVGGVAGIGAVAVVDSFLEPCRGVAALFDINHGACVNGHYVGYGPRYAYYHGGRYENGRRIYQR
jgi:hypothetical protein